MTYNEARNLLGQQKWRLENNEGFEAWLDTTEHYINDIFEISSTQAANFRRLKSDYSISKILLNDDRQRATNENSFRLRAKQQITGLIGYLNEKEALELKEQERKKELNEAEAQRRLKAVEPAEQLNSRRT
jgi:ribosomal protein RSM22 (predicted rRNA methylase)